MNQNTQTTPIFAINEIESYMKEQLRLFLQEALNALLIEELTSYLGYEPYDTTGYNTGNSRNGYYDRTIASSVGELHIKIPRDRLGKFEQHTIPPYKRDTDALEATVIHLYEHGVTTSEIADLIEKMYGHYYSKETISNITEGIMPLVEEFHNRPLSPKYTVVYADATFISVRRDCVDKEALHVLVGITPEGTKEVLDYRLYPTESAENYEEMLRDLKDRGVEQIDVLVSDGLSGLKNALRHVFPDAKHQSCWTHLQRTVERNVRPKDREEAQSELKEAYQMDTTEEAANKRLDTWLDKWAKKYPSLKKVFEERDDLFSYLDFPIEIRRSLYTSNLIESFNSKIKKAIRKKEQFPNEESLDRFIFTICNDYNQKNFGKAHHGFKAASDRLLSRT